MMTRFLIFKRFVNCIIVHSRRHQIDQTSNKSASINIRSGSTVWRAGDACVTHFVTHHVMHYVTPAGKQQGSTFEIHLTVSKASGDTLKSSTALLAAGFLHSVARRVKEWKSARVRVCVCVCEGEREREDEGGDGKWECELQNAAKHERWSSVWKKRSKTISAILEQNGEKENMKKKRRKKNVSENGSKQT